MGAGFPVLPALLPEAETGFFGFGPGLLRFFGFSSVGELDLSVGEVGLAAFFLLVVVPSSFTMWYGQLPYRRWQAPGHRVG